MSEYRNARRREKRRLDKADWVGNLPGVTGLGITDFMGVPTLTIYVDGVTADTLGQIEEGLGRPLVFKPMKKPQLEAL